MRSTHSKHNCLVTLFPQGRNLSLDNALLLSQGPELGHMLMAPTNQLARVEASRGWRLRPQPTSPQSICRQECSVRKENWDSVGKGVVKGHGESRQKDVLQSLRLMFPF